MHFLQIFVRYCKISKLSFIKKKKKRENSNEIKKFSYIFFFSFKPNFKNKEQIVASLKEPARGTLYEILI